MEGSVVFSTAYSPNEVQLIEVPEALLQGIEEGKEVYEVVGGGDQKAVFVTGERTFRVDTVESSNTLLLVNRSETSAEQRRRKRRKKATKPTHNSEDPMSVAGDGEGDQNKDPSQEKKSLQPVVVRSSISHHMALYEIYPSIYQLYDVLRRRPFSEEEAEAKDGRTGAAGLLSFDDLGAQIQSSPSQLKEALKLINAVEIDGFWRVLEDSYADDLVEYVLATIEMNGWAFDAVPLEQCIDEVKEEYPTVLILHALDRLSTISEKWSTQKTRELDVRKICAHKLEFLFHKKSSVVEETELLDNWAKLVPRGIRVDKTMLVGYAIDIKTPKGTSWIHMNHLMLPSSAEERMGVLFEYKQKWKLEDLKQYMEYFKRPGDTLKQVVLRHAREVDGFIVPVAMA